MKSSDTLDKVECKRCHKLMIVKVELMRPEYIHYAKALCSECGRFYDWVRDPANDHGGLRCSHIR